jgi:tRNA-(ms[2]io[6]A)-hydroxylase
VISGTPTPIRWLVRPSSRHWLEQAIAQPEYLLIDHAHCERKAAGAALQLMFRYPSNELLAAVLSPLAQEELAHFDRVLTLLQKRGIALRPLAAPPYGAQLAGQIRKQEPLRQLDTFLVAGLIEARSHERMALLASHHPDQELSNLYRELLASEARHFGLYWLLCERYWPRQVIIPRLEELASAESNALIGELAKPEDLRFHSFGVNSP